MQLLPCWVTDVRTHAAFTLVLPTVKPNQRKSRMHFDMLGPLVIKTLLEH
jgi:hypothetical protein